MIGEGFLLLASQARPPLQIRFRTIAHFTRMLNGAVWLKYYSYTKAYRYFVFGKVNRRIKL